MLKRFYIEARFFIVAKLIDVSSKFDFYFIFYHATQSELKIGSVEITRCIMLAAIAHSLSSCMLHVEVCKKNCTRQERDYVRKSPVAITTGKRTRFFLRSHFALSVYRAIEKSRGSYRVVSNVK